MIVGDVNFEDARREIEARIKQAVAKAAFDGQAIAMSEADVETGYMASSVQVELEGLSATVYTDAEYAPYREFGTGIYAEGGKGRKTPWVYYSERLNRFVYTRGAEGHPFMRPAYERVRPALIRNLKAVAR